MTIRQFNTRVAKMEGKKVSVNQAQIDEVLRCARTLCARSQAAWNCWNDSCLQGLWENAARRASAARQRKGRGR